jgi:hypothetical protein
VSVAGGGRADELELRVLEFVVEECGAIEVILDDLGGEEGARERRDETDCK